MKRHPNSPQFQTHLSGATVNASRQLTLLSATAKARGFEVHDAVGFRVEVVAGADLEIRITEFATFWVVLTVEDEVITEEIDGLLVTELGQTVERLWPLVDCKPRYRQALRDALYLLAGRSAELGTDLSPAHTMALQGQRRALEEPRVTADVLHAQMQELLHYASVEPLTHDQAVEVVGTYRGLEASLSERVITSLWASMHGSADELDGLMERANAFITADLVRLLEESEAD